ncbi:MAG: SPFH domain-containing protein [Chitinispirillaceae bacterium]|nr:SPFH domain-containing protein [Chitinispirillaceae bacterium]
MGLIEGIRRQLRSIIEWENIGNDVLFELWSENGDEIKNASKLIVAPGQGCIFVYEGRIRATIIREGMIDLTTENIPFWTTISRIMQSFESEHKVGIYFFKRTEILNQKWGTTSPIKYDDSRYKIPVSLKAYGNYSFRIVDPKKFYVNVVGGRRRFCISELRETLINRIKQPLADYLAEAGYSYAQIDAQREEIAAAMGDKLASIFSTLGFSLTDFRIEGTSFDDDTLRRINRIADLTAEAQAAEAAGLNYSRVQQLEAMRDAARNEGGAAGMGMGLGAGVSLGNMMANSVATGASPPSRGAAGDAPVAERLAKLKSLAEGGLITPEEYESKKREILKEL